MTFVASSISYWYSTEGKVPITQVRSEIFKDTFTSEFGSVVYASTVVDVISVINWLLIRLNRLIFNSKKSFLLTTVSNLEKFASTSAYANVKNKNKGIKKN